MTEGPDVCRSIAAVRVMWLRRALSLALVACTWAISPSARAQYVPGLFPIGVPGYGEELGVTVVSRLHPLYEEQGARVGSFTVHLNLDETAGYNSNVLGLPGGKGSMMVKTSPSLAINSNWSRNAFGMSFGADNFQYPAYSSQNRTNWTVAIGGGYTIGRTNLTVSYAHLSQHQSATSIGAPPSSTPIAFTVDDMRIAYPIQFGALKVTPNFEASLWRYGDTVIDGISSDQSFRNTNEYRGGAAFNYALTSGTSVILTLQAIRSSFVRQLPNSPSLSSTSGIALGGLDYQYDGVWRYQALVGLEVRAFDAAEFNTKVAPIARVAVIWTPTGLTTVTATVLRAIEDPTQAGNSGFTYTSAELRVDHEYAQNLVLHALAGGEFASYLQDGGTQSAFKAGVGASWLINRHMRMSADYMYTSRNNFTAAAPLDGGIAAPTVQTGYDQNLFLVSMHFGL